MPLKCENLRKDRKYLGIESGRLLCDQAFLGWVSGDKFYFAIDYTKNDDVSNIELPTTIGSIYSKEVTSYLGILPWQG